MPSRRALLAAVAGSSTALAGCLGNVPGGERTDDGDTGEPAAGMRLSLSAVDDDLEMLGFAINIVTDRLSATEMPTLDIRVENVGDEPVSWEQAETDFAFPATWTTPHGLAISTESKVNAQVEDGEGCLRTKGIGKDGIPVTTELDPGEALDQRYAVVASDPDVDGPCPPPDVYRAESEYGNHGTWGFELELEPAG